MIKNEMREDGKKNLGKKGLKHSHISEMQRYLSHIFFFTEIVNCVILRNFAVTISES